MKVIPVLHYAQCHEDVRVNEERRTHWTGGWVGPRSALDTAKNPLPSISHLSSLKPSHNQCTP